MRVLVVMSHPPLLEGGAAARCAVGLLRGLAEGGIDCTVLCTEDHGPVSPIPDGLAVELVPRVHAAPARVRWERLVRPLGRMAHGSFAERLRALARDVDVVHFVEAEAAMGIDLVDRPALAQLHCLTRRDPRVWNPLRAQGRVSIELLRGERRVRRRARWLLANSAEVAEPLAAAAPHAEVRVAPLALDPAHYEPRAELSCAPELSCAQVGLIGTARWPPTRDAVERLLTRVWPLVVERLPQAQLLLAGRGMERSAFSHLPEPPGVQWRAAVPSATDFLRELGVLLYPLTAGSGAKVKVLEALALGIPVVTTPEGAEGLGGRGGVEVQTEDRALADAVIALCEDRQARLAAGAAAYETFVRFHAPAPAAVPVIELYERMVEQSRRGGGSQRGGGSRQEPSREAPLR